MFHRRRQRLQAEFERLKKGVSRERIECPGRDVHRRSLEYSRLVDPLLPALSYSALLFRRFIRAAAVVVSGLIRALYVASVFSRG